MARGGGAAIVPVEVNPMRYLIPLLLLLAACRTPPTTGAILADGWASATDVVLLDIPAACPAQRLEYAGWQIEAAIPASVEFVVSQMGSEVLSTANGDFADYTTGTADWTLEEGRVYALTVRGVNARWRFLVTCR